MCRLFGIRANKSVDISFSLFSADKKAFGSLSAGNPDGWGIGWYDGGKARVYREPVRARDSERFHEFGKEVRSDTIICHVRKSTGTPRATTNSHPFSYADKWLFAHNGSVDRGLLLSKLDDDLRSEIKGETDSEVYFYWILQCIRAEGGDVPSGVSRALSLARKGDPKGLNFLMSDGERLYALRDATFVSDKMRSYYSLYRLKRSPTGTAPTSMQSKETRALLQSKCLAGEEAVLFCSEKLTCEPWEEMPLGTLMWVNSNLDCSSVKV